MTAASIIAPSTALPIELAWHVDGTTGWGLMGLHLTLELSRLGHSVTPFAVEPTGISPALLGSLSGPAKHCDVSEQPPARLMPPSNKFKSPPPLAGRHHVALAVFEEGAVPPDAAARMREFDLVIAPSEWCASRLEGAGLPRPKVWHQGYDSALFHPRRKRRTDPRWFVFSGGALQFRKGHDIVVEAFRRFLHTPEGRDAVLVTAWQNSWPHVFADIESSGYLRGKPDKRGGLLDITAWLNANGIPAERHIDLGCLSQPELASVISECDVGLFPNRSEGATNLLLAECVGSGLPCIVSWNTGHLEYAKFTDRIVPLHRQGIVPHGCAQYRSTDGWGESDPDECVDALVRLRRTPMPPGATHAFESEWDWPASAHCLSGLLVAHTA